MPTKTYYFDTNALWKYYLGQLEYGYVALQQFMVEQNQPVLVSDMTLLEFVGRLTKGYRKKEIQKNHLRKILQKVRHDIEETHLFEITHIPTEAYNKAQELLINNPESKFGSNDALHLAVVYNLHQINSGFTMVTFDEPMQRICQRIGLDFYDPETP